jgi:hypothetical protein
MHFFEDGSTLGGIAIGHSCRRWQREDQKD